MPCRSHAVTATALAATALGIPAAVSSAAVVDLPPAATSMEVDAGVEVDVGAAPVVAAIATATLAAPIEAAEDVNLHGLADAIPAETCEVKIKQGLRKGLPCAHKLPCRFHIPDLFKVRCDLCFKP